MNNKIETSILDAIRLFQAEMLVALEEYVVVGKRNGLTAYQARYEAMRHLLTMDWCKGEEDAAASPS